MSATNHGAQGSRLDTAVRRLPAIAWTLAIAVALSAAWHRVPWTDEGNFSSPAFNLSHHGFFGTTTLDPSASDLLRIEQRTYWTMPLHSLLLAGWFLAFPPTCFSARLLTVLCLPVLGWLTFCLARRLTGDRRVAAVATALLSLDYVLLYTGSWARPDVLCATLGLAALCAYLSLREADLNMALAWATALLVMSALAHPNALMHAAGLAVMCLHFDRRRLRVRMIVLMGAVGLLVATPYLLYVVRDWEAFFQQLRANAVGNGRFAAGWNPLALLWGELSERYGRAYGLFSPSAIPRLKSVALVTYGLAVVLFLTNRRARAEQRAGAVLALWGVYFSIQCVFNQKLSVYLVNILPIYAILAAAAVVYLLRRAGRLGYLIAAWVSITCVLQAGGLLWISWRDSAVVSQRDVAAFLRTHAGNARRINGSASLVYALGFDQRLKDDRSFGLKWGIAPEVIIVDDFYRQAFQEWETSDPAWFQKVRRRLAEYDLAYDRGGYQVYLRRTGGASGS